MTVHQIMSCERIISCVPYAVKASAIEKTIHTKDTTPDVPATKLKEHKNFILYVDMDSAKEVLK